MIQLYVPGNENFSKNGDMILNPVSCLLNMEINGSWTVELNNALDGRHRYIVQNAVLSVPTPYGSNQLFRIQKVEPSDNGVYAIALPLFLDAKNEVFIYDKRPTEKNGQEVLNILLEGTKYFGHSNIETVNTSYYQMKNFMECIAGDDENSFLNRWGGEVRYSNYDIYINQRLGQDNGSRVEFGFNLDAIKESIDMSNVVTQIIPVAFNGYTLPNEETIDSSNINKYPIVYKRVINYQDIKLIDDVKENEENITVCNTLEELHEALRTRARQEYDRGIDLPSITYDVDMIDLSRTLEYRKFKSLVTVNLGDDVYVKHKRLDIETKARIIQLGYDCVTRKTTNLIIGDYVTNYFDKQSDITRSVEKVINTKNNTVIGNKIQGVIDLMTTSLKAQKNLAHKQDVRAILFEDLDSNSTTFGALCIGTQGIQISKQRNETNTDWVWGTAISFEAIVAEYIITGILSDKTGKNYWDLDLGKLVTQSGILSGFEFDSNKLSASNTKTFDFTATDYERVKQIIMEEVEATEDDYARLDVTGDGSIDTRDYIVIKNLVNIGNSVTTRFVLNPTYNTLSNNEGVLEVSVTGNHTTKVTNVGALFSTLATFNELYVGGNNVADIIADLQNQINELKQ